MARGDLSSSHLPLLLHQIECFEFQVKTFLFGELLVDLLLYFYPLFSVIGFYYFFRLIWFDAVFAKHFMILSGESAIEVKIFCSIPPTQNKFLRSATFQYYFFLFSFIAVSHFKRESYGCTKKKTIIPQKVTVLIIHCN